MIDTLARTWWVLASRGVLAILFGIGAFAWPGLTLTALVLLFGGYALVDGVFAVIAGVSLHGKQGRWWMMMVEGLAGIVFGVLVFTWPRLTTLLLLNVIAFYAIVTGAFQITAAIRLRREIVGEWVLGLAGLMSVLFGLLMLVLPGSGALALIWLIGSYAVVFGILMLGLAGRVHDLQMTSGRPAPGTV